MIILWELWYIHTGTTKKEWAIDTGNNIGEPQNNYAQWKEPDQKNYMLYDLYTLLENAN